MKKKVVSWLLRDINTKRDIVMLSMGDFTTQLLLMLQGGDKVDLVSVINSFAGTFINNKMVLDLGSYVEQYGEKKHCAGRGTGNRICSRWRL